MTGLGHGDRFAGGHLHSIGNRCWCGYLAVPNRFHTRDKEGNVVEDGKAEGRYFDYLRNAPEYVNPPCMAEIKRTSNKRTEETPIKRTRGRPKKWKDDAERMRAKRGGS